MGFVFHYALFFYAQVIQTALCTAICKDQRYADNLLLCLQKEKCTTYIYTVIHSDRIVYISFAVKRY